jgi:enoyl-CoA hydratase/carnithine racemase
MNWAGEDSSIGAVVLTGADGVFSSGGNLKRLINNREKPKAVQHQSILLFHDSIRAIRRCPKPVIAAVEGKAAGAGFSLALACDLLVAAEDAQFLMAYVRVGLSPDGGATAFLARGLTPQLLAEIFFTGGPISAPRLQQLGVINRLCGKGQALAKALAWAESLAAGPSFAIAHIKDLLDSACHNDLDAQLAEEQAAFLECLYHPQCHEGIAAFLEKRQADYNPES